jgi:L-fuconolactonase
MDGQRGIGCRDLLTRRGMIFAAGATIAAGRLGLAQGVAAEEEIIDVHAHIMSKDLQKYPATPIGGQQSVFSKDRPQTFEEYVAQADSAGVRKAAIVQVSTLYGVNDAYLADSIAKDPKRFVGVFSIDTLAPDNVKVLEEWRRKGLTGLRIFTLPGDQTMLVNPKAAPVWEYAQAKDMTVCISSRLPEQVVSLLKTYPKVRIVLDHTDFLDKLDEGAPYASSQFFWDMAQYPNLYLKATPTTWRSASKGSSTGQAFMEKLVATFGANRIAFGSDLPSIEGPLTKIVDEARDAMKTLTAKDRAMVFAGTAKRLYPGLG